MAAIAREDLPLEVRRSALRSLAQTPQQQAKRLMQATKISVFAP